MDMDLFVYTNGWIFRSVDVYDVRDTVIFRLDAMLPA